MRTKLQFISLPEERDPYQFMDRLIHTARHMLGFGAELSEIRERLLKEVVSPNRIPVTEEQVYLAYKAAQQLNKE